MCEVCLEIDVYSIKSVICVTSVLVWICGIPVLEKERSGMLCFGVHLER